MEPVSSEELTSAAASFDWKLTTAVFGAISGWLAAVAGWSAFFRQRQQLNRNRAQDQAAWYAEFKEYRRKHIKPLTETLRAAYSRFVKGRPNAPSTWEEVMHRARYPSGLPLTQLEQWHTQHRATLDAQDEYLMKFAEYIYPPCSHQDNRTLQQRSSLSPNEYMVFDTARGGVADYFDLCGRLRQHSSAFAQFLESRVRSNHQPYVKLVTYLELAYVRGLGQGAQRGPGKANLFELGNAWKGDDPRR